MQFPKTAMEQELVPYGPGMARDSLLPVSSVFVEATTLEIQTLYEKDEQRAEFNYRGRTMVIGSRSMCAQASFSASSFERPYRDTGAG